MCKKEYRYLFPFEKIPPNANILLYGAGVIGQAYLEQLTISRYCNVVGFVDKNHANYTNSSVPVYAPGEINSLNFDFVVISLRVAYALPEIKRILHEQGVNDRNVVYVGERVYAYHENIVNKAGDVNEFCLAYQKSKPSLAVHLIGGFGDMVNQKRFVVELASLLPYVEFDLFVVQNDDFVKWLYSDCPYINNVLLDLGTRYNKYNVHYSLSISILSSVFLQVDNFKAEDFQNGYDDFIFKIKALQQRCQEEGLSITIPNGVAFHRRIYSRKNCYSWFNYDGVFNICDHRVHIPTLPMYEQEFHQLNIKNFITVNIGNGACKNGNKVAKSWPVIRFQKTLELFHQKYPQITIVQIGALGEDCLPIANIHLMGKHFGLIASVLKRAVFHLDIEGGLVHLASQIGTKCVVLFGPTSLAYNAYEQNINIKVGNCHDCFALYMDSNRCARNMTEPECMYSITPELVMKEIDQHFGESLLRMT